MYNLHIPMAYEPSAFSKQGPESELSATESRHTLCCGHRFSKSTAATNFFMSENLFSKRVLHLLIFSYPQMIVDIALLMRSYIKEKFQMYPTESNSDKSDSTCSSLSKMPASSKQVPFLLIQLTRLLEVFVAVNQ